MRRKLFAALLSLAMVFSLVTPVQVFADENTFDYDGGSYVITTAADMTSFVTKSKSTDFAGLTVTLAWDIDMSGVSFSAIGPASGTGFAGTFDGQGHTISNLSASLGGGLTGMFRILTGTATNFTLDGCAMVATSGENAGVVAGKLTGTVSNVTVINSSVSAAGQVGGIAGQANGGALVSGCTVTATTVTGTATGKGDGWIGGIIGSVLNGAVTVENCSVNATVSGFTRVGGIVGYTNNALTVTGCTASGTVTATYKGDAFSGGVLGIANGGSLTATDCYVDATLVGQCAVGGILSDALSTANVTVDNCVFAGQCGNGSGSSSWVGGMMGGVESTGSIQLRNSVSLLSATGTVTASKGTLIGNLGSGKSATVSNCFVSQTHGWSPVGAGAGTLNGISNVKTDCKTWTITSAAALMYFAKLQAIHNFSGGTVKLGTNIDLNPGWTASASPAVPANVWAVDCAWGTTFVGTFDGDGKTISGLYIDDSRTAGEDGSGFIKHANAAVIKDVTFTNSYLRGTSTGSYYYLGVATACAEGNSSVTGITLTDTVWVTGIKDVGGVVGLTWNAVTVSGCSAAANVSSTGVCGGIIGRFGGNTGTRTIENNVFSGTVTGYDCAGGIAGGNNTAVMTLTNCTVSGATVASSRTTGEANVGGVIGNVTKGMTLTGCTVSGTVESAGGTHVGGVVGCFYTDGTLTITDTNCTATVTAPDTSSLMRIGGFVGGVWKQSSASTTSISNSRFGGTVTCDASEAKLGGFIGIVMNAAVTVEIANCLMDGAVETNIKTTTGGLIGGCNTQSGGTMTIDKTVVSGSVTSNGGGKTGALLGDAANRDITITDTYYDSSKANHGKNGLGTGGVGTGTISNGSVGLTTDQLAGVNARVNAAGLFADGGDAYWKSVIGNTPQLESFPANAAKEITVEYYADISAYRGDTYTAPVAPAGAVFGGWYADATLETPISESVKDGAAYAKFVDANALRVMYQQEADRSEEGYSKVRIVTTADSMNYQSLGFRLQYNNGTAYDIERGTTKVYQTLTAMGENATWDYTPDFYSKESVRFFAFRLKTLDEKAVAINGNGGVTATAYWITLDGTKVYGADKVGVMFPNYGA